MTPEQISAIDAAHIWHPYSRIGAETIPPVVAVGADGAWLTVIHDGAQIRVLDAMASWWTAIHGHGHPELDAALTRQLQVMNHVMFGGLTHEPAARLAELLVDITPVGLDTVFFSDSGSVGVEVDDPGVLMDVDTEADLAALRASTGPAAHLSAWQLLLPRQLRWARAPRRAADTRNGLTPISTRRVTAETESLVWRVENTM